MLSKTKILLAALITMSAGITSCVIIGECVIINSTNETIEVKTFLVSKDGGVEEEIHSKIRPNEKFKYRYDIYWEEILKITIGNKTILDKKLPREAIRTKIEIKDDGKGGYEIMENTFDVDEYDEEKERTRPIRNKRSRSRVPFSY